MRPDWWPSNPFPASVFTLTAEQLRALIPSDLMRTGVAGLLMRQGWELASEAIYARLLETAGHEPPSVRVCALPTCDTVIVEGRHDRAFCSDACRKKAYRLRKKQRRIWIEYLDRVAFTGAEET